jgi:signal transduction histidine kinase
MIASASSLTIYLNGRGGLNKAAIFLFLVTFFLPGHVFGASAALRPAQHESEIYLYEDTKQLVALVEGAAGLMEKRGTAAFRAFGEKGSKWFDDKHYFFVYDVSGRCLFHPVEPELVGKNLMGLKDMNGKPVIRMITDVAKKPGNRASGWVFYLWEDGTQISPLWKGSYIRKVVGPNGKIFLLGSGLYTIKIEKEFIRERVDEAAELLLSKGRNAAFEEFRNPATQFYFLYAYIFVLRMDGTSLVDPSYPTHTGRDLSKFRDVIGSYPVREMIKKLKNADIAWVQYMWPKPGSSLPSRKLVYARKVKVGEEFLIVGSEFFLAMPIWMRG